MNTTFKTSGKVVNGVAVNSVAATGRGACRGSQVVIKQMPCTLSGAPLARSEKRTSACETFLRIGSVNVGSLTGRCVEVVEMVDRRRLDMCCLQETRWKGSGAKTFVVAGKSYKLFWSGGEDRTAGVGVLVAETWVENVLEVRRCCAGIMLVRIMVGKQVVNLLSVYAPQAGRTMVEKEVFWIEVGKAVDSCSDRDCLFLCGDMNGHVGMEANGFEGVHGGNGYGARNIEGEMLLEFAEAKELVILNTAFKKRDSNKVTYVSGDNRSQIDYMLVRKVDRKRVRDVKVIPGEPCLTQHRLLVGVVGIGVIAPVRRKVMASKCRVWKLKEVRIRNLFCDGVRARLEESMGGDVNEDWIGLRDCMLGVAEEVCGRTKVGGKARMKRGWGEEVVNLVKEKRNKYLSLHRSGLEADRVAYRVAKKRVKVAVAKVLDAERCDFIDEMNSQFRKGSIFRMIKNAAVTNRDVTGSGGVKNAEGTVFRLGEEKRKIWKEYYEKLLNEEFDWDRDSLGVQSAVCGPAEQFSLMEVRLAITKAKNGKASGPSGVVVEMLKACEEPGLIWMSNVCNKVVRDGCIPEDWRKSWMVNVYKGKGDALECGSYRGIKLLEQPLKILERVVERRLRRIVRIDEMQFGFTPGRGATDAIFIVRQVQERFLGKKRDLWMAFVDLEKAFDRVPREVLWWALRVMLVDDWIVKIIQSMYYGTKTSVKLDGDVSDEFEVKVGVHQGSVLSPLLFIIVLEAISREFRVGLPWELLYADDLALIADTEETLMEKISVWRDHMEAKGLRVNVGKTKVMHCVERSGQVEKSGKWPCAVCLRGVAANSIMCGSCKQWVHKRCSGVTGAFKLGVGGFVCVACVDRTSRQSLQCVVPCLKDDSKYELVNRFRYLGDMVGAGGGAEEASRARVRSAWCKFRELAPFLTKRGASLTLKGKLYNVCVRSVLIYGSETWEMRVEDMNRLVRAERSMVRAMCRVSLKDGKSSEELLCRLGIVSVVEIVEKGRLRWFGHVERKMEEDWVSKCRVLEVAGGRGRGRPKKTWKQCVDKDRGKYGLLDVKPEDKDKWRVCCCSHRPTRASMENGRKTD